MEKVRPWCDQLSDQKLLKHRIEHSLTVSSLNKQMTMIDDVNHQLTASTSPESRTSSTSADNVVQLSASYTRMTLSPTTASHL